jgi:hypothetical protein
MEFAPSGSTFVPTPDMPLSVTGGPDIPRARFRYNLDAITHGAS